MSDAIVRATRRSGFAAQGEVDYATFTGGTDLNTGLHARFNALRERLAEPRAELSAFWYRLTRNALPYTVQTLQHLSEEPPAGATRLVLFAHFDARDEVDEYVRVYLQSLHACGCAIVFVSGSPNLSAVSAEKIKPYCAGIFTQATRSLDFGSWNLAWQQVCHRGWKIESFQQFILANDSAYGPLFPLHEMLSSFTGADMYGMTESNERGNHLQSYFLVWDVNARTTTFLRRFWRDFRYVTRKQALIDRYETGISRRARKAGLRLRAYAPDAAVREAFERRQADHPHADRIVAGEPVNNTLLLWDVLVEEFRCPLLKADLPRTNRYRSPKVLQLSDELRRWTEYDPALIENNLRRLGVTTPGKY